MFKIAIGLGVVTTLLFLATIGIQLNYRDPADAVLVASIVAQLKTAYEVGLIATVCAVVVTLFAEFG